MYPSISQGQINGQTSPNPQTGLSKLGANGDTRYGIYAPLAGFNISFDNNPISIQSIDLRVTIKSYGSGYSGSSPMTASILVNNSVGDDFAGFSVPNGIFNEDINWFTSNGWADTGADFIFPTNSDILSIGSSLSADITSSLSHMISGQNNNQFAIVILADSYNGSNLSLGTDLDGGFESPTLIIDYSAVPEPSTYALILGALVLGFVALRRK